MSTQANIPLSDIRMMILCGYPLPTEEYGHFYYDGDEVTRSTEEAYVWYRIAQQAGNRSVDSVVDCIGPTLTTFKCHRLSSRAEHIYSRALQH